MRTTLWGMGSMGNGKFYEIGTSLAKTADIANGIYGKRVDTKIRSSTIR